MVIELLLDFNLDVGWIIHSLFTNIKPECHLRNDQTLKQTTLLKFCYYYIITIPKSTIFLTKQAMIYYILSKRDEQGSMLA